MSVHFTKEQYNNLRNTYRLWWKDELTRPIVPILTVNHPSDRDPSPYPCLAFPNAWDFSISPEQFVDAHDAYFSAIRWHGDAFPFFPTTAFGPGVMAAFLGCKPVPAESTVWFEPPQEDIPIEELHFEYDAENHFYRRVLDLYRCAAQKWNGSVVIGMVDMGGILDVLASFRGTENLLCDLYDSPEEVLRCVQELQTLWFRYYGEINAILSPDAPGYSQWFPLYGEKPGYILQCDFSYMISPAMFDTFVLPELSSSAARLSNPVYHMDGIGQIPHLDSLLSIDAVRGIQWVPGAGAPEGMNWDELLEKILASGKKLISCNQQANGLPIRLAKNAGQLYFGEQYYSNITDAQRYAALFEIEIDENS